MAVGGCNLRVVNGCTGRYFELQMTDHINCLAFAPGGNHIVVGTCGYGISIVEVDLQAGTLRQICVVPGDSIGAMAFSPSGDRMVVWADQRLKFYDSNYVEHFPVTLASTRTCMVYHTL